MIDTYKHKGLREKLVELLREKGIADERVLSAIQKVPRHVFLDSAFTEAAYEDRALPIAEGQTISQPYTVAMQSKMLDVSKGMKVLEIGTGSGYQAAVLCEMGANLFSIERIRVLHNKAKIMLDDLGHQPRLKWGDGSAGWEINSPFDRILVTAASPDIPDSLKKQLAIGGKMVIPVGDKDSQVMTVVVRTDKNEYTISKFDRFKFVPMIGKHGWTSDT